MLKYASQGKRNAGWNNLFLGLRALRILLQVPQVNAAGQSLFVGRQVIQRNEMHGNTEESTGDSLSPTSRSQPRFQHNIQCIYDRYNLNFLLRKSDLYNSL